MSEHSKRRVVWLTGAGKGIGHALALKLAAQGWVVAASARTASDLDAVAAAASGMAGAIMPYPLDIGDLAAVRATVAAIETALGPLSLAILNAGTYRRDSALHFDARAFQSLIEVNLNGTANCLDALLARFVERGGGRIAVVASVAGYRGLPGAAAYAASKAGLIALCEALQPELHDHGVALSLINPGFVDTPLTRQNDFPMPFLIGADRAADLILRGIAGGRFETVFPWAMAVVMKIYRLLPYAVALRVARTLVRPDSP